MTPQNCHPKTLLEETGLRPNKRFGQNFLVSDQFLRRVVRESELCSDDVVLEVGCGFGRLTALLSEKVDRVVGVEIDRGLYAAALERLADVDNVELVCGDFLESKHTIDPDITEVVEDCGDSAGIKVVSNLPYCISSPAIVNLLEWQVPVIDMHVMLQAEVVDRLVAEPGTSEYGPLTVMADYQARTKVLFSLPPSAFWPPPEVASKFVRITPRKPIKAARSYDLFVTVVNRLMQNRRKTLRKGLALGWNKEMRDKVLQESDLSDTIRPGKLSIEDYIDIANIIARNQKKSE